MKPAMTMCLLIVAASLHRAARADVQDLLATQTAYRFEDGGNSVLLTWTQSAPNPGGLDVIVNGAKLTNVPGLIGRNELALDLAEDGPLAVALHAGGAPVAAASLEVEPNQPIGDAVNVACEPGEEDCEVIIVFSNTGPPGGTFQVLAGGVEVATLSGDTGRRRETVRFEQGGEQCVTLQCVLETPAGRYAGDPGQVCCQVSCGPPPARFVRGTCDGSAEGITISTAVFGLSYLFSGGRTPPCRAACDANGDQVFDLSDMVYVLGYLFLGTPAPVGWADQDQDGRPDPTCETAPSGECDTATAPCAG